MPITLSPRSPSTSPTYELIPQHDNGQFPTSSSIGDIAESHIPLKNIQEKTDDDYRTKMREHLWVKADIAGIARNVLNGTAVLVAGTVGLVFAACIFAIYGGALMLKDGYKGIKETWKAFGASFSVIKEQNIDEGIRVAAFAWINQMFYTTIATCVLGWGATELFTSTVASSFHYASQLSNAAMKTCDKVAACFGKCIAALSIARGLFLIGRALNNLYYLLPFQNDFRVTLNTSSLDDALQFLETEFANGELSFTRRVGGPAAEAYKKWQAGTVKTPESKAKLLLQIDQGIYIQICKQYLYFAIGVMLIAGGIAALVCSGGTGVIIGLGLLAAAEVMWFIFDKDSIFTAITNSRYAANVHPSLQEAFKTQQDLKKTDQEKAEQVLQSKTTSERVAIYAKDAWAFMAA